MKRFLFAVLLAAILTAAFGSPAQSADTSVRVTGRVARKLALSVDPSEVNFGSFDPDTPQALSPAFTATVKANGSYSYTLECPATFTGPGSPDIGHLEWDRLGAAPVGYLACSEGAVDSVPSAPATVGTEYSYALRLTMGYEEDPGADYTANLRITCVLW